MCEQRGSKKFFTTFVCLSPDLTPLSVVPNFGLANTCTYAGVQKWRPATSLVEFTFRDGAGQDLSAV